METKISKLLAMMDSEDWLNAIKFAAKFHDLGCERDFILRAKDAIHNPLFFQQIKKDPELLIAEGKSALRRRYVLR